MDLAEGHIYHIFNRGINKQLVYRDPGNYIFFLHKVRRYLLPVSEILAYCLMPNHFHFLLYANKKSVCTTKAGALDMQLVSAAFKDLLSSYTKAYNKMNARTGSLFVQNTQCKDVTFCMGNDELGKSCFHYIHQNPWKAKMVDRAEDWHFSSCRDYLGIRNGTLCNQLKSYELLGLDQNNLLADTYRDISKELILKLY